MKYLNALNKVSGIGPQKIRRLLGYFDAPEAAWKADFSALEKALASQKLAEKICQERTAIDPDLEWEKLEKENIRVIDFNSSDYPSLLKEINNPPYLLYLKGNISLNNCPAVSIVGSRKSSAYGEQLAFNFARDLARAGFLVISGLALGIDAIAHRGALEAHGRTAAVLGSSLDDQNIYPRANFNLAREIIENQGLLISEYPPETPPSPITFPARNRIVAGLSLGTLVIEAAEDSGALITAKMALESNREVFAIPGSIFSNTSQGTNNLIKSGAKLVSSIQDILEEIGSLTAVSLTKASPKNPETKEEEAILHALSEIPTHIDKIGKLTTLGTAAVASNLSMMEIKGWIKDIGGQNYILL